jgi:prepilin-type N-terminal cleavage/methylation domain-containing protein
MIRRGLTLLNLSKRNFRGFTVVELIIVIVIMGVLLAIGVNNFRASQISSRDMERKSDIESLSLYLDIYYNSGTDISVTPPFDYPSTLMITTDASSIFAYLRDIDETIVEAPGIYDPVQTFVKATNNTQTTAGVLPQPTYNTYVYQPIQSDGSLCTLDSQDCRKYNLYYRLEADNLVYVARSKYQ